MDKRSFKRVETPNQALTRLAYQARELGIQIFSYDLGRSVEFFATSTSRPGTLHRVTLLSCDCPGFIRHQRCTHHARLLDEVGELPTPEPPDPAMSAAIVSARAELMRLEDLGRRNMLKSTADFRNLSNARAHLATLLIPFGAEPVALPVAASAAA